jgi:hypothetical protein
VQKNDSKHTFSCVLRYEAGRERITYLGIIYINTESTVYVGHLETEEPKGRCKSRK